MTTVEDFYMFLTFDDYDNFCEALQKYNKDALFTRESMQYGDIPHMMFRALMEIQFKGTRYQTLISYLNKFPHRGFDFKCEWSLKILKSGYTMSYNDTIIVGKLIIKHGDDEELKEFLSYKLDVDYLKYAIKRDNPETVLILLNSGLVKYESCIQQRDRVERRLKYYNRAIDIANLIRNKITSKLIKEMFEADNYYMNEHLCNQSQILQYLYQHTPTITKPCRK